MDIIWVLIVIAILLWLLGYGVAGISMYGVIHLLLFIALVVALVRVIQWLVAKKL